MQENMVPYKAMFSPYATKFVPSAYIQNWFSSAWEVPKPIHFHCIWPRTITMTVWPWGVLSLHPAHQKPSKTESFFPLKLGFLIATRESILRTEK